MKRRSWKSESNFPPIFPVSKRLAALFCVSSLLAFSATSCGLVEMRDATSEVLTRAETTAPTLQQAERYSVVESVGETETMPETEAAVEEEPAMHVALAVAGGVRIDDAILSDAASRAAEGKDYSFLTMYANIFPVIQNADMTMVTLQDPVGDGTGAMPMDSLTALTDLGFDVINVAGTDRLENAGAGLRTTVDNVCTHDVLEIGAYKDDIDAGDVRVLEQDGVRVAYVAFTENADTDTDGLILHDLTDAANVSAIVTYADLVSDVVVVSVTWDNGTDSTVRAEQRSACQLLAEAGADIIVGNDGRGLQTAEWLTAEDGTQTLAVYSLGYLLSTGSDAQTTLSGVLTLDVVMNEAGETTLEDVQILPVVKHYTAEGGYQVTELTKYTADMAALHGLGNITVDALQSVVNGTLPAAFLPTNN